MWVSMAGRVGVRRPNDPPHLPAGLLPGSVRDACLGIERPLSTGSWTRGWPEHLPRSSHRSHVKAGPPSPVRAGLAHPSPPRELPLTFAVCDAGIR